MNDQGITMSEWKIALISVLLGVVVGFVLNELSQIIKKWCLRKQLKAALLDELDSNFHQLDQKIDIAHQMKTSIQQGKFLPSMSVPFASSVYSHHFASILKDLTPIQRDNIRHIYSNLILLDEITFSLETSYKEDMQSQILADISSAYLGKIDDIINNYHVLKQLIASYIEGKPKDIYYRNRSVI